MLDPVAANKYLTEEERGWLEEAREEIAMDAVGLCHDVPVMLGRYAAALEALEEAQGKLEAVEVWSDKWPWSGLLGEAKRELDRILRGTKEDE